MQLTYLQMDHYNDEICPPNPKHYLNLIEKKLKLKLKCLHFKKRHIQPQWVDGELQTYK